MAHQTKLQASGRAEEAVGASPLARAEEAAQGGRANTEGEATVEEISHRTETEGVGVAESNTDTAEEGGGSSSVNLVSRLKSKPLSAVRDGKPTVKTDADLS